MAFFQNRTKRILRDQHEQVIDLQRQRSETKARIAALREEMNALVRKAAEADDLDRKILALDYEERKSALAALTEHFSELSKLIAQLNGVSMVYERQRLLEGIASVSDTIDTREIQHIDNRTKAYRSVMQEESDMLDDLLSAPAFGGDDAREDPEFTRLVALEQRRAVQPAQTPEPAGSAPAEVHAG